MADYDLTQGESVPSTMKTKYEDMGDGTHAEVVSVGGATIDTITLPTVLYHGVVTVATATTRIALAATTSLVSGVYIRAAWANTGTIYVGGVTVAAANGLRLAAGESVFLEIANLATVYVDASVNAQVVTYIAS